jgi:hypothetical protein
MKTVKLLSSFLICSIAILLPYRLRILFSEIMGWGITFFYKLYIGIIEFIIKRCKQS